MQTKFRQAALAVTVILAGCESTEMVTLPNGTQGYAISCPGNYTDISDCMNEAAKVCGGPYQIVTQDTSDAGGRTNTYGRYTPNVQRTLVVECGSGQ